MLRNTSLIFFHILQNGKCTELWIFQDKKNLRKISTKMVYKECISLKTKNVVVINKQSTHWLQKEIMKKHLTKVIWWI